MVENAGMVGGCAVGLRSTMVVAAGRRQQPQRFVASGIIQFLVQLWESGIFVLKIFLFFPCYLHSFTEGNMVSQEWYFSV
jgi:hypothetical protein